MVDGPGVFDRARTDAGVFERAFILVLVLARASKSSIYYEQTLSKSEQHVLVAPLLLSLALVAVLPRSTVVPVAAVSMFFLVSFCRREAERVIRPPNGISDIAREGFVDLDGGGLRLSSPFADAVAGSGADFSSFGTDEGFSLADSDVDFLLTAIVLAAPSVPSEADGGCSRAAGVDFSLTSGV